MHIIQYILVVVEVASSLLLIGVILLQKTKSHGAGMVFGAEMGESLFGAQAGNVLTKITVILAAIFLVNTAILAWISGRSGSSAAGTGSVTDKVPVRTQPMQSQMPSGEMPAGGVAAPAQSPATTPFSLPESGAAAPDAMGSGQVAVPAAGEPAQPVAVDSTPASSSEKATDDKPAQQ